MSGDPTSGFAWSGLGDEQFLDRGMLVAREDKMDRAIEYAIKSQSHLWTATACHQLTEKRLAGPLEGLQLDGESLLMVVIGCYICEEPFKRRLLLRRCPGEPKR